MLIDLLSDIERDKGSLNIKTALHLDGCKYNMKYPDYLQPFHHLHKGRNHWWKLWNIAARKIENARLVISLQDDLRLKPDFFQECIRHWNNIGTHDPSVEALNLLYDKQRSGKAQWGSHTPYKVTFDGIKYLNAGWTDMIFITDDVSLIKYDIEKPFLNHGWAHEIVTSSGVGSQVSKRFARSGSIYQVTDTLVYHDNHESLMNPDRGYIITS